MKGSLENKTYYERMEYDVLIGKMLLKNWIVHFPERLGSGNMLDVVREGTIPKNDSRDPLCRIVHVKVLLNYVRKNIRYFYFIRKNIYTTFGITIAWIKWSIQYYI